MAESTVKNKTKSIRTRAWALTIFIVVALLLYIIVKLTTGEVNWIDFAILVIVQLLTYTTYFPEGENFGQQSDSFISNKNAYNTKANKINTDKKIGKLREYCNFEYEQRKTAYVLTECGIIGITLQELEILKKLSEKETKTLKEYCFKDKDGEKLVVFSKFKRKRLYKLLFCELPVAKNSPSLIMSAVEHSGDGIIKDGSVSYKTKAYIKKAVTAIVVGGFFAYISFSAKDGISIAEVVKVVYYIVSLFATAVLAYSSGETNMKVHKSRFYVELSNFIDGFNEWESKIKSNTLNNGENAVLEPSLEQGRTNTQEKDLSR